MINLVLEDQHVVNLLILVSSAQRNLPDDSSLQKVLRDMNFKLSAALRSAGWIPCPGGGWKMKTKDPLER